MISRAKDNHTLGEPKEKVIELLKQQFNSVYCDSCESNETQEHCEDCQRKMMCWGIADATATRIANKIDSFYQSDLLGECLDALKTCFDAIQSIPIDSLGVGREVMTAPDGEAGELTWPIRDEVLDSIKAILNKTKEEANNEYPQ